MTLYVPRGFAQQFGVVLSKAEQTVARSAEQLSNPLGRVIVINLKRLFWAYPTDGAPPILLSGHLRGFGSCNPIQLLEAYFPTDFL
jgi:hypothetical protein